MIPKLAVDHRHLLNRLLGLPLLLLHRLPLLLVFHLLSSRLCRPLQPFPIAPEMLLLRPHNMEQVLLATDPESCPVGSPAKGFTVRAAATTHRLLLGLRRPRMKTVQQTTLWEETLQLCLEGFSPIANEIQR